MIIRISMIFFAALLVLATIGRYQVEADLRNVREEHRKVTHEIELERERIQQLTLDVEVLESKQRLTELARGKTALRPVQASQMHSQEDFITLVELNGRPRYKIPPKRPVHQDHEFISNALAMADYGQITP